jgi:hypothetical protein
MKTLIPLALLPLLFSASCGDEEVLPSATLNLNFKAVYDSAPLVMYQVYDYPDGRKIRFQHFNFFISDVTLVGSGETADKTLTEVEFLDFSDKTTAAEAQTPLTFPVEKVPAGTYSGVKIGIGVTAADNKKSANQLPQGNALKDHYSSHFWSDWGSFIFMKSEGIYDLDNNGVFNGSDVGFEHHPGTDQVYVTLTLQKNMEVTADQPLDLNFVVDILKIYAPSTGPLDLSDPANKNTQEASDIPLALWLTNNFQQALALQ